MGLEITCKDFCSERMGDMCIRRRYVAMCDVLGFTALNKKVESGELGLDELGQRYYALLEETDKNREYDRLTFTRDQPPEVTFCRVPWAVFSDTILLWLDACDEENHWGAVNQFFSILAISVLASIHLEMPLRIGIAYGECYIDTRASIFLGPPIVNAYDTERSQNWVGGALHPSCTIAPGFEKLIQVGLAVPFQIPTHKVDGSVQPLIYALNWVETGDDAYQQMVCRLEKCIVAARESPSVEAKYVNTMTFHSHVGNNGGRMQIA